MSVEHKKEYSIFQIALNLTCACFISGVIIAGTYYITAPVTAKNKVIMENNALKALVKGAENFKPVEGKEGWFVAQKGGKTIAFVVPSESKGFGGAIKMLVAVSPDGTVIDYDIMSHNETPGLGDNAAKEPFKSQLKGKKSEHLIVVKDPSNKEDVQAITGATITSRAVTKGIKEAVEQVTKFAGGK
jgi:electron transport complex protein RnfG